MLMTLSLLLTLVTLGEGARLLAFFPLPIPSHHFVFRPVLEELGKRGHQILYVTAFLYKDSPPPGIEQLDISEYLVNAPKEESPLNEFRTYIAPKYIKLMYEFGYDYGKAFLSNPKVQKLIHSDEKFDAVLFESYFMQEYLSAFIHKFNAIGIDIMTLGDFAWVNEMAGLPDNPSYQRDVISEMTKDMNFWQRLYNTYVTATTTLLSYYYLHSMMQPLMDQFFNYSGWEGRPSIGFLAKNRSLILANASPFLGYPSPSAPHYKTIGGINIKPNKPLPQEMDTFMNESKHGVIYMSFGSYVNMSQPENENVLNSFLHAFKGLPQRVMLKFEIDYKGELPSNVKMYKWMPQQDILAHKNTALFITHGGLLSLSEAVFHGVPVFGVPFFADQGKNLRFVESEGIGRMIKYDNITPDNVLWNMKEILTNNRYKEEMARRSQLFRDRRHSPAEEAVYWIEHSLKYPFALTPKAASLSFLQLHMIDVISFVAAVFLAVMVVVCRLTYCIVRAAGRRKQQKKEKRH